MAIDMPNCYSSQEDCVTCATSACGEKGPDVYDTREYKEECEGYGHLWRHNYKDYFIKVMKTRK